ncbi:phosphotransferase family protein, partial [Brevundimonas sp.]|uniref:phosphotransferase family protein n=1 Tax=Brevundimonas sp. TaxID=1871086 RepID=UPI00185AD115
MTQTAPEDAQSTFSGTREVDPRYALDEAALDRWLSAHVEGYAGPLTVRQFKGGQSNPTYELVTPGHAYVLRRKPPGTLLPSAHAVDREFTVISALHRQGYPVARPYALCTDDTVIGSMFYVMDKVEGRVLWDLKLPGMEPAQRRAIYDSQVDTLAALHAFDPVARPYALCTDDTVIGSMFYVMDKVEGRVLWDLKLPGMEPAQRRAIYDSQVDALAALHAFDPVAIGLGDYGRPGNYFERQVGRWTKQYRASEIDPIPAMDRLIEFLPATLPPDGPTRIVHGDFRLDNLILAPDGPQVRAVLDWELSTLGDPMADFSYLLIAWVIPATARNGLAGADIEALGIPSVAETV